MLVPQVTFTDHDPVPPAERDDAVQLRDRRRRRRAFERNRRSHDASDFSRFAAEQQLPDDRDNIVRAVTYAMVQKSAGSYELVQRLGWVVTPHSYEHVCVPALPGAPTQIG